MLFCPTYRLWKALKKQSDICYNGEISNNSTDNRSSLDYVVWFPTFCTVSVMESERLLRLKRDDAVHTFQLI